MTAVAAPLNTQTIMDAAHVAYTQATDTPLITDTDGVLRLNLLNKGIDRWQFFNGVRWRELYAYNASAGTVAASTIIYPLSSITDFRELSSRLRIANTDSSYTYVTVVSPEKYARYMDAGGRVELPDGSLGCCVIGNPSAGYQIHLGWIPQATDREIGGTIYFDYYRYAKKMNAMTDIPEMQNPQFLVAYITGELFVDDDTNLYTKYNSDSMNLLGDMSAENDVMPDYESNALEDRGDWAAGGGLAIGV